MASVGKKHTFSGTLEQVYTALCRFSDYPEYIPGVMNTEVLPAAQPDSTCQVRYEINIIKKFYYILDMYTDGKSEIWWELAESNIMKKNSGRWNLKAKGSKQVDAEYNLDVGFRGLVPKKITEKVAATSLPAMFTGFQKLIDDTKS